MWIILTNRDAGTLQEAQTNVHSLILIFFFPLLFIVVKQTSENLGTQKPDPSA